MMRLGKRMLAAGLAAGLLAALAACGVGGVTAKDASTYIQGDLDATYKGICSQDYIDLVEDMTEADAEEMYQSNIEWEAENLMYYLAINFPDDAVTARAQELVKEIYSNAKYTVGNASKMDNGDYAVEVVISPIEVLSLMEDNLWDDHWNEVLSQNGVTAQEQIDAMSDEEYTVLESQYGMLMLDEVEALMSELTYGEDQSVMLQLKKDDEGYYSPVSTGYQKLDEIMIDYYGTYLK